MALTIAFPLTILSTRVLSVSAISGRMNALPFIARQTIRWVLIFLRSIPELVWALVFVRVVGLGPTAGVLAIALTYGGMLGKVYGEILESGETTPTETLLRNGSGRLQAFFYGLLPQNVMEPDVLHGVSLGMCHSIIRGFGFCRCRRTGSGTGQFDEDVQWWRSIHHADRIHFAGSTG